MGTESGTLEKNRVNFNFSQRTGEEQVMAI